MPKHRELPSAEYLLTCFSYDPKTGDLFWKARPITHFSDAAHAMSWNTKYAGTIAGWRHNAGYRALALDFRKYLTHRIIYKIMTGHEPGPEVDHQNRSRSGNHWENLRPATRSQNASNCKTRSDSIVGLKGVRRLPGGRFQAHISINRKFFGLGTFQTAEEAHAAFCQAAERSSGDFFNPG